MSEDLSEGEKGDIVGDVPARGDSVRGRMPRVSSFDTMENWASPHKDKKLYIVLIRHEHKLFLCNSSGISYRGLYSIVSKITSLLTVK